MVSNTVELKQKSLLCDRKGERANVTPPTQEAPLMRLSVASLRRMIKGKLSVEFVHQDLTSYSGLELLRRYLRQLDLPRRLRTACASTGGDYGGGPPGPAYPGVALRGGPPPRAPALCRRRSPDRPLLRVGAHPNGPHGRQLAAPVHADHPGPA